MAWPSTSGASDPPRDAAAASRTETSAQRTSFPPRRSRRCGRLGGTRCCPRGRIRSGTAAFMSAWRNFGDARFRRLAEISPSPIYNLRGRARFPSASGAGQARKASRVSGWTQFIRDSTMVARACITQCGRHRDAVAGDGCMERISEQHLIPVLEATLSQFPLRILSSIATTVRSSSMAMSSSC